MADNIKLVTYAGSTVTPQDDALVYESAISQSGIIYGAEITLKNVNTLHINAGHGIVCGRKFTIVDSDIAVQLTTGATSRGRLYLHLDLSNTTNPLQILTEIGSTLTDPIQQEDVNINNGVYEFNLVTFDVDAQAVSNVVNVFPVIEKTELLETLEEVEANTEKGKSVDALAVKELNQNLKIQNLDSLLAVDIDTHTINSKYCRRYGNYILLRINIKLGSDFAINSSGRIEMDVSGIPLPFFSTQKTLCHNYRTYGLVLTPAGKLTIQNLTGAVVSAGVDLDIQVDYLTAG